MFVIGISKLYQLLNKYVLQIKIFNFPVFYLHDLKSMLVLRNFCSDMYYFQYMIVVFCSDVK